MTYNVMMHTDLEDQLDEGFSPMDGIQAINDVYVGLPVVHVPRQSKRRGRRRKTLRIFTARLAWYPLAVSYVQITNTLHILDIWCDDNPGSPGGIEVDFVLPTTTVVGSDV